MMPSSANGLCSSTAPDATRVTSTTVGASLRPDSASSAPVSRLGSGTTRSTENTAAASVGDVTAPSSSASSQGRPRTKWDARATMVTDTATPTVANETPRRIDGRISRQLVVRPPSARMIARAANPRACASSASSKWMLPGPDSPSTTPMSR